VVALCVEVFCKSRRASATTLSVTVPVAGAEVTACSVPAAACVALAVRVVVTVPGVVAPAGTVYQTAIEIVPPLAVAGAAARAALSDVMPAVVLGYVTPLKLKFVIVAPEPPVIVAGVAGTEKLAAPLPVFVNVKHPTPCRPAPRCAGREA